MLILALDTTSEAGGAGIFEDDRCLAEVAHAGAANQYSVAVFEMTERLAAKVAAGHPAFKSLADIDLFAVANGPGSFTGIRVGVAVVQAWAKVFGKPAKGISTLEALAESAQPATPNAVAILNAYRGEFYVGEFRRTVEGRFEPIGEARVATAAALADRHSALAAARAEWTCLVRAHDRAAQSLRGRLPAGLIWQIVDGTLLGAMARIAGRAVREGRLDPPGQLGAYYVRHTDAELNWKD
jgi:tRNA threonylcarbamoyladenosine biosynthesis protein TsaB